jgi:hypothetical protein
MAFTGISAARGQAAVPFSGRDVSNRPEAPSIKGGNFIWSLRVSPAPLEYACLIPPP